MAKFTVAIVGAGMSGLVFALALRKLAPDVEFHIYEGAHELIEVGAGISMQQRAWSIMQEVGLADELKQIVGSYDHGSIKYTFRKSDQDEGVDLMEQEYDDVTYTFHRADLQKALLQLVQQSAGVLHLGKRLKTYVQPEDNASGPTELHFQDGTTAQCDILVGADGIRSAVRGWLYTQLAEAASATGRDSEAKELRGHIKPVLSGYVIYRSIIRKDDLPEEEAKRPGLEKAGMNFYCGKNRHIVAYPISQGRVINVAAVVGHQGEEGTVYEGPWSTTAERDEVVARYSGWESDVEDMMRSISGGLKWTVGVVTKLPTYVQGRVALMGDAAHAMTPFQGVGAGQGFEDAYILARLLGRPDVQKSTLPTILRVYDSVRRPFSQNVAAYSLLSGETIQLKTPQFADLSEEASATGSALSPERLKQIGDAINRASDWRNVVTVEEEVAKAFRELEGALSRNV